MNIFKISYQNLKSKPSYTLLSVLLLSLSIALLLGMQQLKSSFEHQMENNLGDIDMVLGAKGSPMQLTLASVLHLDNPTGNIPYKEAHKIAKNRLVKKAVPISYGDNFKGFRIVGTTDDFYDIYKASLEKGTLPKKSLEVVIGSNIAKQLKLSLGTTFNSSHGLVANEIDVHDAKFTVVGVLQATHKVIDQLIVTNLESVWDVHDHKDHDHLADETSHSHHEHHIHDEDDDHHKKEHLQEKEITSMLISFKNPMALLTLPRKINKETNMQAALPKYELERLYKFTGIGMQTITTIAYIILCISGMLLFISLYKMVKERAFEIALLRTYGASNFQLIRMVFYEGLFISLLSFVIGILVSYLGTDFLIQSLQTNTPQSLLLTVSVTNILNVFGLVLLVVILATSMAIYPMVKMNISTILSNEK